MFFSVKVRKRKEFGTMKIGAALNCLRNGANTSSGLAADYMGAMSNFIMAIFLSFIAILTPLVSAADEGSLVIKTEPRDADIYIDDKLKASGTPAVMKLSEGSYALTIKKEGYEDHTVEVFIGSGSLSTKEVRLRIKVSARLSGGKFRDCEECPEMVVIPAGSFRMGDLQGGGDKYEYPVHKVTISSSFALGRHEVTFDDYKVCVWDGVCDGYPDDAGWGRGQRPVINVSWQDAQAYVKWLSRETGKPYRLPSEAEWEYAARAGTTTQYSFGDAITPKDANYLESKLGKTTEVGAYPPNPWGLYDMHGNVWEWVEDVYHDSYNGAPSDGSAWTDGEGQNSSRLRVYRGGSWYNSSQFLRSAFRVRFGPDVRLSYYGFRVARTLD